MPRRLPTPADFPAKLKLSITPPPSNQPPTSIIILLHGLGDSHDSFTKLGQQMSLPETACISLQAPKPLLDLGGFHWGDDIMFDQSTEGLDPDAGFKEATVVVQKLVIEDVLLAKCGYTLREIIMFGYGQGGMAALSVTGQADGAVVALHSLFPEQELGGIIAIGGPLSSEAPPSLTPKCKTPILVCGGASKTLITPSAQEKFKNLFEFVEFKTYRRPGDSMPSNRDEMMPIMQFFARRLRSVRGVPEGSVEIH